MQNDGSSPSSREYIDAVFGPTGYLSTVFPGYTPRTGQVALARAVDHAIAERTHLLAEGPTGTGKSLAYAVPASYFAAQTGKPVVIVTANIALQEQIVNKDLPLLQSIVPWDFTYALLKGRNNYLCEDKRLGSEGGSFSHQHYEASLEEKTQLDVVRKWAKAAARREVESDGDVSELPFEPLHRVWKGFSVTADECKGQGCRYKNECFANAALAKARSAKVIVTNYHMLFAHLRVFLSAGLDVVLPPFEVVVLDEAHKAADIARDFFGFDVSQDTVKRIGRRVRDEDPQAHELVDRSATYFFALLGGLRRDRKRYKARLTGDYTLEELEAWTKLGGGLERAVVVFGSRLRRLERELEELKQSGGGMTDEAEDLREAVSEAERDVDRGNTILENLRQAMSPRDHDRHVFFLEEDDKTRITVKSKLVCPGDVLETTLFDHTPTWRGADGEICHGHRTTVIATSATLATNGTSFDFVANELGVPKGYGELVAQSPFDWSSQCLFIVPAGLPEPNSDEFKHAVAATVERAVLLAGGRTLALFTSRRVLEHTYDTINGTCRRNGIRLLRQGDAPRTKLIAEFKEDVSSVLLGTESFWAGVDVPGEACSVVIIDRLPFPTPDDPVLDVMSASDDAWFFKYSVPRAMIAFKQGFGRLIRARSDRGVVICLDSRITSKRYGKDFLRSLPAGIPKSTRLEALVEWLNPAPEPAWDDVGGM